ncbi:MULTISPECIES: TonB family protein [Brucella]|uniref:Energy transducer TonB n=3 Tax=Brucella TaxID=234 RepID=A0AAI8E867_BRUSS|nr:MULTISPECIES: energy transducer TonB [Brucella]AAN30569.1 TonB-dependent receptor [Brucella suis 1330]AEM18986.1 TonB-dependent receptor [Brucella suis 1330]AEU06656.1 TonB-dependent receptor [Brucella suis VBI22]AHN47266.1 TonB-dependent receptor [Brucella suis bv. 1 str. S2]AIN84830.1 energy transducer TonB [Brucella suis]
MNAPAPVHPPVKVVRTDSYDHSFWRDAGRWLGAGVLVLLVHAAGAYVIHMAQEDNQPEGTEVAAMVVELVPDLVAPAEERVSEEVQPETTTEQPEEVQPEPEPEPQPEAKAEPQQVQEPEEVIPDVVEAQKPEVAVPLPVEKPQEKPEEKPKAEPKPEPKKVEKLKPQKPKPEKVKPKKAEKAAETREASAPRVDADNGAKVAASKRGETSASAGVIWAKWTSRLQSHMARNARFLQGKSRNTRGEAHVAFVIDPSGNVLSARIAVSSGDPAVDQLALEAARRASPVPAPPAAIAKVRMPITMPLLFK